MAIIAHRSESKLNTQSTRRYKHHKTALTVRLTWGSAWTTGFQDAKLPCHQDVQDTTMAAAPTPLRGLGCDGW